MQLKYTVSAVLKYGCRLASTFVPTDDGQTVECIYDGNTWVGGRRVEAASHHDCPGVDTWVTGETYESCAAEQECLLYAESTPGPVPICSGQVL